MQLRRFILETQDGQTDTGEIEKGARTHIHTQRERERRGEKIERKREIVRLSLDIQRAMNVECHIGISLTSSQPYRVTLGQGTSSRGKNAKLIHFHSYVIVKVWFTSSHLTFYIETEMDKIKLKIEFLAACETIFRPQDGFKQNRGKELCDPKAV